VESGELAHYGLIAARRRSAPVGGDY
jgi:hypothetical protein